MIEQAMYTDTQLIILEASSVVTGFISLIASLIVIYSQLKNRKRRLQQMYERIILGSSIMDVIVSCQFVFLGPWAIPSEVDFVVGATGSFTTCSLSGFLANFTLGALVYSASLSVFFVLRIVCEIKEHDIKKCFEPFIHSIACGVPLASAIYALSIDAMNPIRGLPGNCWMNVYPPECLTQDEIVALIEAQASSEDALKLDEEFLWSQLCLRGEGFETVSFFCGTVLIGLTLITIMVSMCCIILKVYNTEKRLRAYAMSGSDFDTNDRRSSSGSALMRTRQTCVKALWYVGCFAITYFGLVSYQGLHTAGVDQAEARGLYFTFALFAKFFAPLYGFWQCIIYFRYASPECREEVATAISGFRSSMSGILRMSTVYVTPAIEDLKSECFEPLRTTDVQREGRDSSMVISIASEELSILQEEDGTDVSVSMQIQEEEDPESMESMSLFQKHPARCASLPTLPQDYPESSASFQMLQINPMRPATLPTLLQEYPERSASSHMLQEHPERSSSLPILPQGHHTHSASLQMVEELTGRSTSLQILTEHLESAENREIEKVGEIENDQHHCRQEFHDEL